MLNVMGIIVLTFPACYRLVVHPELMLASPGEMIDQIVAHNLPRYTVGSDKPLQRRVQRDGEMNDGVSGHSVGPQRTIWECQLLLNSAQAQSKDSCKGIVRVQLGSWSASYPAHTAIPSRLHLGSEPQSAWRLVDIPEVR